MSHAATLPTVAQIDMWPHVDDDSGLFSLDYAEQCQTLMDDDDSKEEWYTLRGWLFDLCEAYYIFARETGDTATLAQLARMGFRAPSLRSVTDLDETARDVYEALRRRGRAHTTPIRA